MSILIHFTPNGLPPAADSSYFWGNPPQITGFTTAAPQQSTAQTDDSVFIAQINCAELAPFDKKGLLPHSGFLCFRGDIAYFLGLESSPPQSLGEWDKGVEIVYLEELPETAMPHRPDAEEPPLKPLLISFEAGSAYADGLKLLGQPYESEEVYNYFDTEWILLLQLDSVENNDFELRFYDMGFLYLMIEKKRLEQRDFSQVKAFLTTL